MCHCIHVIQLRTYSLACKPTFTTEMFLHFCPRRTGEWMWNVCKLIIWQMMFSCFVCVFCLLVFSFMWKIRWQIEHLTQLLIDPHLCNTAGEERYLFKVAVVWNAWRMSRMAETLVLLINGDAEKEECTGPSFLKTEVILSNPSPSEITGFAQWTAWPSQCLSSRYGSQHLTV